jgi:hypothetical protein
VYVGGVNADPAKPARRRASRPTSTQLGVLRLLFEGVPDELRIAYLCDDGDVVMARTLHPARELRRRISPEGITIAVDRVLPVPVDAKVLDVTKSTLGV